MCNGFIRWSAIAEEQGTTTEQLKKITGFKAEKLEEMKKDGLLDYDNDYIKLTDQGWFFVRNVAALFDPMRKENSNLYSKSV
jgi:oxygen-independent coproporphyrinogen-3 oxidase